MSSLLIVGTLWMACAADPDTDDSAANTMNDADSTGSPNIDDMQTTSSNDAGNEPGTESDSSGEAPVDDDTTGSNDDTDGSPAGDTDGSPDPSMSFFVTSTGSPDGGNLGGLDGADAICQGLADAVGADDKTWRAYLSTDTVNARERIGTGPWYNQAGQLVAQTVDELHADDTIFNGDPNLILDETGVNAPGNEHDVLTGSDPSGMALAGLNCDNWTSNDASLTENPQVGHSDIPGNPQFSPSWNSAHVSANCSATGLTERGGAGRLYCFAE